MKREKILLLNPNVGVISICLLYVLFSMSVCHLPYVVEYWDAHLACGELLGCLTSNNMRA